MTAPDAPLDRLLEHRAWVRGLVRSIVLDPGRADDVEQQVWLTAIEHGDAEIETPRAWLATVARNWARKTWRGAARRERREAAVARPEATGADVDPVERAEAHRGVVDAVLALPEPLRRTALLHYFDGLSVADVAARLDVPHETVRSRLRLARGRLRTTLGPSQDAAAWSPALLALAGLPKDFAGATAAGAGTATLTTGVIAMTTAQKLAFALVVPMAVGAAWVTARVAAEPTRSDEPDEAVAKLVLRVERLEKTADAPKPTRGGEDRALLRRIEAMEARLEEVARAPAAAPTKPGAAPASSSTSDAGGKTSNETKKEHEEIADALRKTKPGSPEHLAALKRLAEWLVKSAGPPALDAEVAWAEGLFDQEARGDRVTPTEAAELARALDGVAPGNAARAGLAAGIAGGWAKDARLADFLARFPTNSEPGVHGRLLVLLDHHPSAAFSDYVMRLVREERDPGLLASVFKADRVEAVATADHAVSFAQAVDARLLGGSLDAKVRSRAACAVAVAGLRAPEACAELLGRIAGRESDARLAESCRQAAAALTDKSATAKTLEKTFR